MDSTDSDDTRPDSAPWLKPFRFLPGQSGNPGGRPKGRSLKAILREALESKSIDGQPIPDGRTVADVLIERLVEGGLKSDPKFLREILDRYDGKATPAVEVRDDVDARAALLARSLEITRERLGRDPAGDAEPDR